MKANLHQPAMVDQVLAWLRPEKALRIVDATIGGGGHAEAILRSSGNLELLGIDRDREALQAAAARLAPFGDRVTLRQGRFSEIEQIMEQTRIEETDGVLFDFGFSSLQLDDPERGFSFRHNGPLDMRMDQRGPATAAAILNKASESELSRIFRDYGEEPNARKLARAIVERRKIRPWMRTGELAELAEKTAAKRRGRTSGPPPPTRCFQALRIAVNDELKEIEEGVAAAVRRLKKGGRIVTVAFHSLEDRIVKNFFREAALTCVCPPDFPECRCDKKATLKVLTKRPLRPEPTEVEHNPRAAPSRLRVAEKI